MMASMTDLVRAATGIQDVEFVRLGAVGKQLLEEERREDEREGPEKKRSGSRRSRQRSGSQTEG